MREPVGEPPTPMLGRIGIAEHRLDPDFAAMRISTGTGRHVVCPQIEGAAARQLEARMMPMAGQDAVLDAAAIERETHMRAAIVEREHAPAVVHEQDRAMAAAHDEPPLGFQLLEAARAHEIRGRHVHGRLSRVGRTIACVRRGLHAHDHGDIATRKPILRLRAFGSPLSMRAAERQNVAPWAHEPPRSTRVR